MALTWTEQNITTKSDQKRKLWAFIDKYTGNPLLVEIASHLISTLNIPARDELKLARAVQLLAQRIKYFREYPERWASPIRTLAWGLGDCDDKTILIAAILRTFRIPVRLKFMRFTKQEWNGTKKVPKTISHVYPLAFVGGKWQALESVKPLQLGQDPEMILRARGFHPVVDTFGDDPIQMRRAA